MGSAQPYSLLAHRLGASVRRREFVGVLTISLFGESGLAASQALQGSPTIGMLVAASPPHPFVEIFQRGLHELGWTQGRTIKLEPRYTEGRGDRAAEFAAELVRLRVDVIVAHFTAAVRAAMGATQTIPIVMAPAGAPLQLGFVDSLARPGGNVTGLSAMDAEIGGKRLELLRDLVPGLARVAVLASTANTDPFSAPFVADLRSAAASASLQLEPVLIGGPGEFDSAFVKMAEAGAQAVIIQGLFDPHRGALLGLAAKHRLPVMSGSRETTETGGLVSISANYSALYERAALFVDKILKGAKPADLPVEQPTKFQVVINLKTAAALGLTLSPTVIARADEVIE